MTLLTTYSIWSCSPCSPRVSHSSVVRASNQYLEGHGFDSRWGLRKFFFWVFRLENASSLWNTSLPLPFLTVIWGVREIETSSRALASGVSSSKPSTWVSQWLSPLSMVVSCLMWYRCHTVVQRRMCMTTSTLPSLQHSRYSVKTNKQRAITVI